MNLNFGIIASESILDAAVIETSEKNKLNES
jgi:hypothetical protein